MLGSRPLSRTTAFAPRRDSRREKPFHQELPELFVASPKHNPKLPILPISYLSRFLISVRNVAYSALPPNPPAFAEVIRRVEAIEGVRFQALFERLPRTAPDGDAALASIWQLVPDAKRQILSELEPLVQLIS